MVQLKPYPGTDVYLWKYLPSVPASATFIVVFTVITSVHCWRMNKSHSWFCSVFAVGGLFQVIGYASRIASYYYTDQVAPYAIQASFILLAPVCYAASIYMVLERIIRSAHGERFSLIAPRRITRIFVWSDIFSLLLQGNGAGLTTHKSESQKKIGDDIVIAGLFWQLATFGLFIYVAVVFHLRMRKNIAREPDSALDVPWRQGLMMLYACSVLIIIRSIYRAVEYIMGTNGYLLTHEWDMFAFDSVPMVICQLIFLIWFPDKFKVVRNDSDTITDSTTKRTEGRFIRLTRLVKISKSPNIGHTSEVEGS